jgi:hypothetical protein
MASEYNGGVASSSPALNAACSQRSPGDQRREAGEINKSLSQLALVIQRLNGSGSSNLIPYRDSMLTRLLADSFGGSSKTCLIITCSSRSIDKDETRCTLEFGKRAKLVKNKAKINLEIEQEVTPVMQALIQKELDELRPEKEEWLRERELMLEENKKMQEQLEQQALIQKELNELRERGLMFQENTKIQEQLEQQALIQKELDELRQEKEEWLRERRLMLQEKTKMQEQIEQQLLNQTESDVAELEERLRRSEEEVRKCKQWQDEQILRELAAEGQRIEELKRVKEDVKNQVEKARQDTVKENCELHKRNRELESEIEALQHDRDAAATRAEDDRRVMEKELLKATSRAQAAELNITEAESNLNEVRDEALAQANALRSEHDAALAQRIADFEMEREAERAAAALRDREHDDLVSRYCARGSHDRWQILVQAIVAQQTVAQSQERWGHARLALCRSSRRARHEEADAAQLQRLQQEAAGHDNELEALAAQNRELLCSLEQAHQERLLAKAEAERLLEREKTYEKDFLKMSERNAELGGHANQKQKIKHLMQIKEDNFKLQENTKIIQRRLMQTQAQLRSEKLFDFFTSSNHGNGGATGANTPAVTPKAPQAPPFLAGCGALCQDLAGPFEKCSSNNDDRPETLRRDRAEAARQVRMHQRATDKAMVEYQHLVMLVNQVILAKPNGGETSRRGLEELSAGNPTALLQHLRELVAVQQTSTQPGSVGTTPLRDLSAADSHVASPILLGSPPSAAAVASPAYPLACDALMPSATSEHACEHAIGSSEIKVAEEGVVGAERTLEE